jgi:hypothetical protein
LSRQAVGPASKSLSIRLAVQPFRCIRQFHIPFRDASLPGLPGRRSCLPKQESFRAFRVAAIRPTVARHSLHLRFAEPIPENLRGAFSDAAAGIASVSCELNFTTLSRVYS